MRKLIKGNLVWVTELNYKRPAWQAFHNLNFKEYSPDIQKIYQSGIMVSVTSQIGKD